MRQDDKAQREIRRIAYALWAEEGQPEGRDREHWERAKIIWGARNNEAAGPGEETTHPDAGRAKRLKH